MDTNMIKRFGPIVLGAVAGGVAGYFLGVLIVKQIEKEREDESQYEEEWEKEWEEELETTITEGKKPRDYTRYAREKGNLSELVRPYTSSIPEEIQKLKSKVDKIYIISMDEYVTNRAMNKAEVTYYKDDDTFANDNEEIIPNPIDLFGVNIHLHFGEKSEDPDMVYVRNENNGCDYEITQNPGSYSVIVGGSPAPAVKEKAKRRRRTVKEEVPLDSEDNEEEQDE